MIRGSCRLFLKFSVVFLQFNRILETFIAFSLKGAPFVAKLKTNKNNYVPIIPAALRLWGPNG